VEPGFVEPASKYGLQQAALACPSL